MALKIITAPSEKALFLVAAFGVGAATLAFFVVPPLAAPAESAAAEMGGMPASGPTARGGAPASGPAARSAAPTSGPAARATPKADARPSAAPPASDLALSPADFPLAEYAALLDAHLDEGWVDYEALSTGEPRAALGRLVDAIARTDGQALRTLRDRELLAWYGNAYNVLTLETIARAYPLGSIMELDQPWDTPFTVAGEQLTLNQIEHDKMRLRDAPAAERIAFVDPRLHFIVNCASIGCPVLPPAPLRAETLDAQMDEGVRQFMADPTKYRVEGSTLHLSQLMDWYGEDFQLGNHLGKKEALGAFFARYEDDRQDATVLASRDFELVWMEYDWGLNER